MWKRDGGVKSRKYVFEYLMDYQMEEGLISESTARTSYQKLEGHRLLVPYVFQASVGVKNQLISCSCMDTLEQLCQQKKNSLKYYQAFKLAAVYSAQYKAHYILSSLFQECSLRGWVNALGKDVVKEILLPYGWMN